MIPPAVAIIQSQRKWFSKKLISCGDKLIFPMQSILDKPSNQKIGGRPGNGRNPPNSKTPTTEINIYTICRIYLAVPISLSDPSKIIPVLKGRPGIMNAAGIPNAMTGNVKGNGQITKPQPIKRRAMKMASPKSHVMLHLHHL